MKRLIALLFLCQTAFAEVTIDTGNMTTANGEISATPLAVNKPAGTPDIYVVVVGTGSSFVASEVALADFTAIHTTAPDAWGNSTSDCKAAAFYKVRAGDEPATFSVTHEHTARAALYAFGLSGVETSNVVNVVGTQTIDDADGIAVAATVSTTVDGSLAFYLACLDQDDGSPVSEPSGWTERAEIQVNTAGEDVTFAWGTKAMPTAGATGNADPTFAVTDGHLGVQFAIEADAVVASGLLRRRRSH